MTENSISVELSDKVFITVTEGRNDSGKYSHYFGMTIGKSRQVDATTIEIARGDNVELSTLRIVHHAPVTKRIEEALLDERELIRDLLLARDIIVTYSQAWADGRDNITTTN